MENEQILELADKNGALLLRIGRCFTDEQLQAFAKELMRRLSTTDLIKELMSANERGVSPPQNWAYRAIDEMRRAFGALTN